MTKTLTVRTIEQAAAWLELDGQLSDGFWENARPNNHWQVWTDCKVEVGPEVGRNFHARKDNYNFAAAELLEVVGNRMLGIIRIARVCGLEIAAILEHAVDCETGKIDWTASWNQDRKAAIEAHPLHLTTAVIDAALAVQDYGYRDMLRDLRELKAAVKTYKEAK
jgi:hypothetical protein